MFTNCTTGEIPYIESLHEKFMSSKALENIDPKI
jgi:hypothetical protein